MDPQGHVFLPQGPGKKPAPDLSRIIARITFHRKQKVIIFTISYDALFSKWKIANRWEIVDIQLVAGWEEGSGSLEIRLQIIFDTRNKDLITA
jgi:hypothetical protein